jgi:hypothetical protein
MKKLMFLAMAVVAVVLLSSPPAVQAQVSEAITLTNQGIQVLTDYPGLGKRYTAFATPEDFNKTWGADVRNMQKAAGLFQDALSKASGASPEARMKLEEAIAYAKGSMHKEARLYAQGALRHLCAGAGMEPKDICDKAPKYGSYVAP